MAVGMGVSVVGCVADGWIVADNAIKAFCVAVELAFIRSIATGLNKVETTRIKKNKKTRPIHPITLMIILPRHPFFQRLAMIFTKTPRTR